MDGNVKNAYSIEIKNRYQAQQDIADDETANTMYENIMIAHNKSAEQHIPHKKKQKRRVPWENDNIIEKRTIF